MGIKYRNIPRGTLGSRPAGPPSDIPMFEMAQAICRRLHNEGIERCPWELLVWAKERLESSGGATPERMKDFLLVSQTELGFSVLTEEIAD